MPEFSQESSFSSDTSSLSPGRHPAYLCCITEEAIPDGWAMREKGATIMYRWHFAVWESPAQVAAKAPEHQTAVSSKTFSPGGKNPQSKAYAWTSQLLGRRPNPGERVNLDPLLPLPCSLKIDRFKNDGTPIDYARILDLEAWEGGAPLLSPELRANLLHSAALWRASTPPPAPAAAHQAPPMPPQQGGAPASPVNPHMVGWGNAQGTVAPPPAKPTW